MSKANIWKLITFGCISVKNSQHIVNRSKIKKRKTKRWFYRSKQNNQNQPYAEA